MSEDKINIRKANQAETVSDDDLIKLSTNKAVFRWLNNNHKNLIDANNTSIMMARNDFNNTLKRTSGIMRDYLYGINTEIAVDYFNKTFCGGEPIDKSKKKIQPLIAMLIGGCLPYNCNDYNNFLSKTSAMFADDIIDKDSRKAMIKELLRYKVAEFISLKSAMCNRHKYADQEWVNYYMTDVVSTYKINYYDDDITLSGPHESKGFMLVADKISDLINDIIENSYKLDAKFISEAIESTWSILADIDKIIFNIDDIYDINEKYILDRNYNYDKDVKSRSLIVILMCKIENDVFEKFESGTISSYGLELKNYKLDDKIKADDALILNKIKALGEVVKLATPAPSEFNKNGDNKKVIKIIERAINFIKDRATASISDEVTFKIAKNDLKSADGKILKTESISRTIKENVGDFDFSISFNDCENENESDLVQIKIKRIGGLQPLAKRREPMMKK